MVSTINDFLHFYDGQHDILVVKDIVFMRMSYLRMK